MVVDTGTSSEKDAVFVGVFSDRFAHLGLHHIRQLAHFVEPLHIGTADVLRLALDRFRCLLRSSQAATTDDVTNRTGNNLVNGWHVPYRIDGGSSSSRRIAVACKQTGKTYQDGRPACSSRSTTDIEETLWTYPLARQQVSMPEPRLDFGLLEMSSQGRQVRLLD